MFTQDALRAELNFAQSKIQKITSEHQIAKVIHIHRAYFREYHYFRVIKIFIISSRLISVDFLRTVFVRRGKSENRRSLQTSRCCTVVIPKEYIRLRDSSHSFYSETKKREDLLSPYIHLL